nr:monooxygenase [uncultured Actinoplanes sp.]
MAVAAVLAVVAASAACGGGEPAAAPPPSSSAHSGHQQRSLAAAPLRAGETFRTLTLPQPYQPVAPGGGTDEYRCFLVDPRITGTTYLTGSQFLPQNADIVHHAIFFQIPPEGIGRARALDEKSPGEGWQCFGDSGVPGDAWVAHWAPGANEVLLGEHLGYEMQPGSQLVMQVHYNLLATGGKPGATDQSGIRLRLAGTSAAMTKLETFQLAAPIELPCTAEESGPLCDRAAAVKDVGRRFGPEVGGTAQGLLEHCSAGRPAPGNVQHCDYPMPGEATVYAAAGHMHLLGRSIKIELNPGTAGARTLLDIPQYNFDDQALRPLPSPVRLNPGDVLRVTCSHDAGLRKLLPQLRRLPPRYVVWGDGTADEMCLGLLIGTALP